MKLAIRCFLLVSLIHICFADEIAIQQQLMQIASEEAQIANIGANKVMMLYGIDNPIAKINRWNTIEHKEPLNNTQLEQINKLEQLKLNILQHNAQ